MDLIKSIKQLMIESPYYGLFLMNLNKEYSDDTPTAEVRLQGINMKMLFNKEFWDTLSDTEQQALLIHETLHICFGHLTNQKGWKDQHLANIASDMEVNCWITGLPANACTVAAINNQLGTSFPEKMGSKWYYDELVKYKEEHKKEPERTPMDDHSHWKEISDLDPATKKIIKNQVEYHMTNAAKSVRKGRGTIPASLSAIIAKLLNPPPPIFNWKAYFRRFVSNSYQTYTKKTRRKESKRFPGQAGIKVKSKHHILVGIDTSGSVSNKELAEFFAEINYMYKTGTQITIVECDAKIQRTYPYKGKFDGKILGRGGTDFTPVVDYFNENSAKYSILVMFTDGYAPVEHLRPKQQMLWVITSDGSRGKYPGHTIYIPKYETRNNTDRS